MSPSEFSVMALANSCYRWLYPVNILCHFRRKFVLIYRNMDHSYDHVSAKKRPDKLSDNGQIWLLVFESNQRILHLELLQQLSSHSLLCWKPWDPQVCWGNLFELGCLFTLARSVFRASDHQVWCCAICLAFVILWCHSNTWPFESLWSVKTVECLPDVNITHYFHYMSSKIIFLIRSHMSWHS